MARPKRKATENKSYDETPETYHNSGATNGSTKQPDSNHDDTEPDSGDTPPKRKYIKSAGRKGSTTAKPQSGGPNGKSNGVGRPRTKNVDTGSRNGSFLISNDGTNSKSAAIANIASPGANGPEINGIPINWQPTPSAIDYFSNKLNLKGAYIDLDRKMLVCPNQQFFPMDYNESFKRRKNFTLRKDDFIYMISEPPGEPYYIGRILGFKSKKGDSKPNESSISESSKSPHIIEEVSNYVFQIQWYYRPRDISKFSVDSRVLFASMHTDTCPLNSFRGVAIVKHRQDIDNIDDYVRLPNRFYFDKLYDRYMIKFYDILSTKYLLDISQNDKSQNFLKALNKRFEFIFVEPPMTKFLINGFKSNSCTCEICGQWCSTQDSVDCVNCSKFYHMTCLDPPLLKKPSRGFSWTCEQCTKIHLRQYKNNKMFMLSHDNKSSNEKELSDDDHSTSNSDNTSNINDNDENSSASNGEEEEVAKATNVTDVLPRYEIMATEFLKNDTMSFEERRLKEEWCMRYLGMHAKLEDAVDVEDRSPYPRASTRVGPKHQAHHIPQYIDHPIVYYDGKKEASRGPGKKPKIHTKAEDLKPLPVPKEFEQVDSKDYPQWLQPRPKGYIERGVDDGEGETCTLLWKPSVEDEKDNFANLDTYIEQCKPIAESLEMSPNSPNFMDRILYNYMKHHGNIPLAIDESLTITKKTLKEPELTPAQIKAFEEGVRKHGSELYPIYKSMKGVKCSTLVRFYYLWKKTKNGRLIWGNYEGRLKKKFQNIQNESKDSQSKLHLFNNDDDSSYDKSQNTSKEFVCKHCETTSSVQWFRLAGYDTNVTTNDANKKISITGLCFRCAKLWRRYAIVWEDPIEVDRKITKNMKKKIEAELLRDTEIILAAAEEHGGLTNDDKRREYKRKVSPSPSESEAESKTKKKPGKKAEVKRKSESQPSSDTAKKPKTERDNKPKAKSNEKSTNSESKVEAEPPRKPYEVETIINPMSNRNYVLPKEMNLISTNVQQDLKKPINENSLDELIHSFKTKRLCDLSKLVEEVDALSTGTTLPETPETCGVCKHPSQKEQSLNCGKCGISVHSSCIGINLPLGLKTIQEWVCDLCTNEVNPTFKYNNYKCCLCDQSGGFLKPVYDTGDWCHFMCALASYKTIDFKIFNSVNRSNLKGIINSIQDDEVTLKLLIENITNNLEIKNVERSFLSNMDKQCQICNKSGALLKCSHGHCDSYYHVTCASTKENFKVGFQLNETEAKIKVDSKFGKLEPGILCGQHSHSSSNFYGVRDTGKKNQTSKEESPLIQLFIDELVKSNTHNKLSGGQLRAYNYISMVKEIITKEDEQKPQIRASPLDCFLCKTKISPIWRQQGQNHICQRCFHKQKESNEDIASFPEDFSKMSDEPLPGPYFGIHDEQDRITNIHTPLWSTNGSASPATS